MKAKPESVPLPESETQRGIRAGETSGWLDEDGDPWREPANIDNADPYDNPYDTTGE